MSDIKVSHVSDCHSSNMIYFSVMLSNNEFVCIV